MTDAFIIKLEIDWDGSARNPFSLFMSQGVDIHTRVGCSISDLLCAHIGIERDYVKNRIQTIFLNGEVVDDMETTIVQDRDVLALSAAMPGVLGATLRKGGRYAAMRSNISYTQDRAECGLGQGVVKIKLFNLVVRELGPFFLSLGITIKGDDWLDLLGRLPNGILDNCRRIAVNGSPAEGSQLDNAAWRDGTIDLVVRTLTVR